jgi:hypothetical protein
MDEIAGIITAALTATTPAAATAKAKYTLDDRVADQSRAQCADLLSAHPLYPTITL